MLILVACSGKVLPAREWWRAGWGGCRSAQVGRRVVCPRHRHPSKWIGSEASQVDCAVMTCFLPKRTLICSCVHTPCGHAFWGRYEGSLAPWACLFLSVHWGLGMSNNLCQWSTRPSWLEGGVGWRWYWCFWERISSIEFLYCLSSHRILSWAYHLCFRQQSLVSVPLL